MQGAVQEVINGMEITWSFFTQALITTHVQIPRYAALKVIAGKNCLRGEVRIPSVVMM